VAHCALSSGQGLPRIQGDATQLRQVIHNLLQNALDAIADRADGLVEVSTSKALGEHGELRAVRLTVIDNGHGFSEKVLQARLRTLRHHQGQGHRPRAGGGQEDCRRTWRARCAW
jgi:signal transduction histidine kinase